MPKNFIKSDDSFDEEVMQDYLNGLMEDIKKCNRGFKAAGRRFRLKTVKLEKAFKEMRALSPK